YKGLKTKQKRYEVAEVAANDWYEVAEVAANDWYEVAGEVADTYTRFPEALNAHHYGLLLEERVPMWPIDWLDMI
ncbi:hypothetical protein Tco_0948659, partial [Tanacetum coccineum]